MLFAPAPGLDEFRNRLTVAMSWAWNYLTLQRGTRLIAGISGSRVENMPMPNSELAPPPLRGAA
jgi:NADH dehydrogenase